MQLKDQSLCVGKQIPFTRTQKNFFFAVISCFIYDWIEWKSRFLFRDSRIRKKNEWLFYFHVLARDSCWQRSMKWHGFVLSKFSKWLITIRKNTFRVLDSPSCQVDVCEARSGRDHFCLFWIEYPEINFNFHDECACMHTRLRTFFWKEVYRSTRTQTAVISHFIFLRGHSSIGGDGIWRANWIEVRSTWSIWKWPFIIDSRRKWQRKKLTKQSEPRICCLQIWMKTCFSLIHDFNEKFHVRVCDK